MSIQFKPQKDDEVFYDNWATGLRDNYKNKRYKNAKVFETQLRNRDEVFAKEGEK
jgi:hypothetical protein